MIFDGYLRVHYTDTNTHEKEPVKIIADFDDSWLVKGRWIGKRVASKKHIHVLKTSKWYKKQTPKETK